MYTPKPNSRPVSRAGRPEQESRSKVPSNSLSNLGSRQGSHSPGPPSLRSRNKTLLVQDSARSKADMDVGRLFDFSIDHDIGELFGEGEDIATTVTTNTDIEEWIDSMHRLLDNKFGPDNEKSKDLRRKIQSHAHTKFPSCEQQDHYHVYGPEHRARTHDHRLSAQLPTVMSQCNLDDFDESLENAADELSPAHSEDKRDDSSTDSDDTPQLRRKPIPWRIREANHVVQPATAALLPPRPTAAIAALRGGANGGEGGASVADQYRDMCRSISQVPVASLLEALSRGGMASPTRSSSRFGTCVLHCAGHMLGCRGTAILSQFLKHVPMLTDLDLSRNSAPAPPSHPARPTHSHCLHHRKLCK